MKNKFDYYEIVKIKSNDPNLRKINGLEGAILGISRSEDSDEVGYSVHIYKFGTSWFVFHDDLIRTGKYAKNEDFYTGETIKVRVNPKTGEGEIVKDEED